MLILGTKHGVGEIHARCDLSRVLDSSKERSAEMESHCAHQHRALETTEDVTLHSALLHAPLEGAVEGSGADLDVEEACFGAHEIEYWVREENRLVPATADEIAQIQEWEREQSAHLRLQRWREDERRRNVWPARLLHWVLARWDQQPFAAPRSERVLADHASEDLARMRQGGQAKAQE